MAVVVVCSVVDLSFGSLNMSTVDLGLFSGTGVGTIVGLVGLLASIFAGPDFLLKKFPSHIHKDA